MGKSVVIVGPMGSGKTSLLKTLETFGYKRLAQYTTRPMREGEIDGIDMHFISEQEFINKIDEGFFAEHTYFDTVYGRWYYGSAIEDYNKACNTVIVLNPRSVLQLTVPVYVVWLDLSDDITMPRALKRGDNPEEVLRRIFADKEDFKKLDESWAYNMRITGEVSLKQIALNIDKVVKSHELHML